MGRMMVLAGIVAGGRQSVRCFSRLKPPEFFSEMHWIVYFCPSCRAAAGPIHGFHSNRYLNQVGTKCNGYSGQGKQGKHHCRCLCTNAFTIPRRLEYNRQADGNEPKPRAHTEFRLRAKSSLSSIDEQVACTIANCIFLKRNNKRYGWNEQGWICLIRLLLEARWARGTTMAVPCCSLRAIAAGLIAHARGAVLEQLHIAEQA